MGDQTLYFKNGLLYKMEPDDGRNYYQARFFVSDGQQYDFENPEDIKSLPVPLFQKQEGALGDVTKCLDYIVRMKAGHLYSINKFNLCSICLRKMIELMKYSTIFWSEHDYYRIVQWNVEMGNFEEAESAEKDIRSFLESSHKYIALRNSIKKTPEIIQTQREWEEKNRDRKEYYKIFYQLPNFAPKSFGGYRRMKHLNSINFQELIQIAEEAGIDIEF